MDICVSTRAFNGIASSAPRGASDPSENAETRDSAIHVISSPYLVDGGNPRLRDAAFDRGCRRRALATVRSGTLVRRLYQRIATSNSRSFTSGDAAHATPPLTRVRIHRPMAASTDRRQERGPAQGRSPAFGGGLRVPASPLFKRDGPELGLRRYFDGLEGRTSPRPDQVLLCSYPGCDSRALEVILWKLLQPAGRALPGDQAAGRCLPSMEMAGHQGDGRRQPRLCKTYLQPPYHPAARYVYVVRSPWGACASYYRLLEDQYDGFDDFFDDFVAGRVGFGDLFAHVRPWLTRATRDNVLVLHHEQVGRNVRSAAVVTAAFLGHRYLGRLTGEGGDRLMGEILRETCRSWGSGARAARGRREEGLLDVILSAPLDAVNELLWRRRAEPEPTLTPQQLQQIVDLIAARMKDTSVEHFWAEQLKKHLMTS